MHVPMMLSDGYDRKKTPDAPRPFRYMTPAEAIGLTYRQEVPFMDRDGKVRRCRVSGKVRTWKRDANRVEVPMKYGLYESATFEARDGRMVTFAGDVALLVAC